MAGTEGQGIVAAGISVAVLPFHLRLGFKLWCEVYGTGMLPLGKEQLLIPPQVLLPGCTIL